MRLVPKIRRKRHPKPRRAKGRKGAPVHPKPRRKVGPPPPPKSGLRFRPGYRPGRYWPQRKLLADQALGLSPIVTTY